MLFCHYPIGTRLEVGVDASFWIGCFAGVWDGVAVLTNAQLFANMGKPIDGIRPVVRIPIRMITFVALNDHEDDKNDNDNDNDTKWLHAKARIKWAKGRIYPTLVIISQLLKQTWILSGVFGNFGTLY